MADDLPVSDHAALYGLREGEPIRSFFDGPQHTILRKDNGRPKPLAREADVYVWGQRIA